MPTLNFKGRKINYLTQGKGNAIVLLHGFCADSSIWDNFISKFKSNKIIRIDMIGFGSSEPVENPSIEYAADSIKAVLDHLEIQQCTLIGHSMGGYVSLVFAKKYESYLNGLGVFHSHAYEDSEEKKINRTRSVEFIKRNSHFHYIKQLFPKLFPTPFLSSNNFLVNKMIHRASTFSSEGIIGGLEMMRDRSDQTKVLTTIKCPVLFIVGLEDEVVPLEKCLEQTALPEVADIHILKGIGHMGMFEAPKVTQKIIQNFINFCVEFQKTKAPKIVSTK